VYSQYNNKGAEQMSKIKVTRIEMPPSLRKRFLVFLLSFPVTAGLTYILDRLEHQVGQVPPLVGLVVFFAPIVLAGIYLLGTGKGSSPDLVIRSALRKEAPGKIEQLSIVSPKSAVALAGDHILVLEKGLLATIPLSAIGDSWWSIPGYDVRTVYGVGGAAIGAAIGAGFANSAAKEEARQNSGFFFKVHDINNPLWQFCTNDEKLLCQWEEIIRQAFERQAASLTNRGGAAAAA
jgi:hypothetical protein